jgi:hypothetical protein
MLRANVERAAAVVMAAAVVVGGVAGCESSGMSLRETRTENYSAYLYSMYDDAAAQQAADTRGPLRTPLRVGVAQVGEVAPPDAMMDRLRREQRLFAAVQPVPAIFGEASANKVDGAEARRRVRMMRQHAQDLGLDYLLLYGGTIDYGSQETPTSVMDLTIVGAYVVPSRDVKAAARASGSLIEVRSGRVVLSASAEGARQKWVPAMSQGGAKVEVLEGLRDEVVGKLAEEVVGRVKERAGG